MAILGGEELKQERSGRGKDPRMKEMKVGTLNIGTMTGRGREVADYDGEERTECSVCTRNQVERTYDWVPREEVWLCLREKGVSETVGQGCAGHASRKYDSSEKCCGVWVRSSR